MFPLTISSIPLNYGFLVGLASSVLINRLSALLHRSKVIYPKNVLEADNEYYYWRYRNFFVSFAHATITGLGSLLCVIQTPLLLLDVMETQSEPGYLLTSFSFGYFVYDTLEMLTHVNYKGTVELVFHHILILLCFSNTMVYHKYIGYNMIALLIEISNIFLHFRQLLLLSNYPRSGPYFQVNCVINIVLFVLVRGSCMVWLWYTLLIRLSIIPLVTKVIALTAMTGISLTTVVLFRRVLNSDFEVDRWTIRRRQVTKAGVSGATSQSSANPSGNSADLYEPMSESISGGKSGGNSSGGSPSKNGAGLSDTLRKRLNGAEHLTGSAANN